MMKKKTKLLAIAVLILLGICFWQVTTTPLPCKYLGWLSWWPGPTKALAYDCSYCCPDCELYCTAGFCTVSQCLRICGEEKENDGGPPQPPDQVEPGQGRFGVFDPNTPDITIDFPPGAVDVPVEVRAAYTDLPPGVAPPAGNVVGAPFLFGAWIRGKGKTVDKFNKSVVINVRHTEYSQLSMYDPNTQAWVKLCGRDDPYENTVSGAVIFPTALKTGGNALLVATDDNTPALEQSVDGFGNTTLSLPGSNFSFDILAGTVEVGTHFEVTPLLNAPNSTSFKLLPTPVDIKACQADYSTARKVRQITQFTKPIEVMFYYDANTLARAGGENNLTIVSFQNRQWTDLEEFGIRIVRGNHTITVNSGDLGTFSMAVR